MAKATKRVVSLGTLALRAMCRGIEKAVLEHRRLGVPMVIWRDGKVVQISASRIRLPIKARKLVKTARRRHG